MVKSVQITSLQNSRIKSIVKLRHRRHRDSLRLTVVEGIREARLALLKHVVPQEAYLCFPLIDDEVASPTISTLRQLAQGGQTELFEVTPTVFEKIAYRGESGGLLLVIPYLECTLSSLPLGQSPFMAIIENVEKPGNLGAILRTADAAGVDGVIICTNTPGNGTDIHNPNVIRASLGTLFSVPVATASTSDVIHWLRHHGIRIVATTPSATAVYTMVDMTTGVALAMGSEAHGLSDEWLSAADEQVVIPMKGIVDSLNLAVSTALLLYEAVRQRHGISPEGHHWNPANPSASMH